MVYKDEGMGPYGHIRVQVDLVSQNISANTSQIRVRGFIWLDSGHSSSDNSGNCKAEISGSYDYGPITANFSISGTTKVEKIDRTFTVAHASDGTKSVTETFTFGPTITSNFGTSKDGVTVSYTLPPISRVPATMIAPTLSFAAPKAIMVSYVAPADNGSAITEYVVQYGKDSTMAVIVGEVSAGTSLSKTLNDLDINSTYYVRVRAINAIGVGTWSPIASLVIPNVPDAITSWTATFYAPSSVTLEWTPPSNNGGATIDHYSIIYGTSQNSNNGSTLSSILNTTISLTGLANGTTYYFWVLSHNTQGYSLESNMLSISVPSAPGGGPFPVLVYTPPSTIGVSYPALPPGESPILEYQIQYDDDPVFASPLYIDNALNLTATLTNLLPGKNYNVRVRARSVQGWGEYGPVASSFTYSGPRIKYGGSYRNTICYVKYDGDWHVAIPYVKKDGSWNISGG